MTHLEIIKSLYVGCKTRGIPVLNLSCVHRTTGQVLLNRSLIQAGTARFFVLWTAEPSQRRICALNADAVELARILFGCEIELRSGAGVCTKAEYLQATGSVAQAVKSAQPQVACKKAAR